MQLGTPTSELIKDLTALIIYKNEVFNLREEIVKRILQLRNEINASNPQSNFDFTQGVHDAFYSVLQRLDLIHEQATTSPSSFPQLNPSDYQANDDN